MDDYAKIVGRNLHDLRSAYRMTQVDLGKKLQCGEANISYWERGKAIPRGEYIPELAKIFHVSIDSLFGMDRATDRIMELQRENTAIRRQMEELHEVNLELGELRKMIDMYGGFEGIQNAFAERDAAVEDLRKLAHEHCTCYACINDKFDYDKSVCTGCPYNNWNNWQWRGIQKEEY